MPSMFPSMGHHDDDLNRRSTGGEEGEWPKALRWGYYLAVAAAVLLILSGLVMGSEGYTGDPGVDQELIDAFLRNVRFLGGYNIVAGLVLAALAAQLKKGGKLSRRWLTGVIALTLFFNVAALAIQVGGFGLGLIVVLLALVALLIFRPSANRYVDRMS